MPIPTGYSALVRIVDDNATDINTELSTQNGNGFWCSGMVFDGAGNALLHFAKYETGSFGSNAQKVNAVNSNQTDINTDITSEDANGYIPTGVFFIGTQALIFYSLLDPGGS